MVENQSTEDRQWERVVVRKSEAENVTYPKLQKHFMFKTTLYFDFIVKFVIIDQVGSRMIVFIYVEYFIN